jgi:hypothetical protein
VSGDDIRARLALRNRGPGFHLRMKFAAMGRPLVLVVTGGRDYLDAARVRWALDGLHGAYGVEHLHAGDATGADALAVSWAAERAVLTTRWLADWSRGKRGGPERNRRMLDAAKPDLVVAFPGGRGTEDCIRAATERGFPVWRVSP